MSDDFASDWIAAAVAETAHLSDAAFSEAAQRARRECNYHGQIIPAMVKQSAELQEYIRKMDAYSKPFLRDHNGEPRQIEHRGSAKRYGDIKIGGGQYG